MKEVIKFESEDGRLYDTLKEAKKADKNYWTEKWYENYKLYGNWNAVEWKDLKEWLIDHKQVILELLEDEKDGVSR